MKTLVRLFFKGLIAIAFQAYKIEGVNALLILMPAKLIVPTLRKYGARIGENVIIHSPLMIHNAGNDYSNLSIGSSSYFGRGIFLDLKDKITIGERVTVSMRVTLLTHTDVGESSLKSVMPPSHGAVRVEDDAYLGAQVTVLQGVRIGEGALIGAGSVVIHDVPAKTVAAGNPSREIRKIQ